MFSRKDRVFWIPGHEFAPYQRPDPTRPFQGHAGKRRICRVPGGPGFLSPAVGASDPVSELDSWLSLMLIAVVQGQTVVFRLLHLRLQPRLGLSVSLLRPFQRARTHKSEC